MSNKQHEKPLHIPPGTMFMPRNKLIVFLKDLNTKLKSTSVEKTISILELTSGSSLREIANDLDRINCTVKFMGDSKQAFQQTVNMISSLML